MYCNDLAIILQLEEFKRKKQEALARRASVQTSAVASPSKTEPLEPINPLPVDKDTESLKQQISHLLESIDDLHKSLADERYNSMQIEEEFSAFRQDTNSKILLLETSNRSLEQELASQNTEKIANFDRAEREINGLKSDIAQLNSEMLASKQDYDAQLERVAADLITANTEKNGYLEREAALTLQLREVEAQSAATIQTLQTQLSAAEESIASLRQAKALQDDSEKEGLKQGMTDLIAQVEGLLSEKEALSAELEAAKHAAATSSNLKAEFQAQAETLSLEKQSLTDELESIRQVVAANEGIDATLTSEVEALNGKIIELQAMNAELQQMVSRSASLQEIIDQQNEKIEALQNQLDGAGNAAELEGLLAERTAELETALAEAAAYASELEGLVDKMESLMAEKAVAEQARDDALQLAESLSAHENVKEQLESQVVLLQQSLLSAEATRAELEEKLAEAEAAALEAATVAGNAQQMLADHQDSNLAESDRQRAIADALQQQNEVMSARIQELESASSGVAVTEIQKENATLQATLAEYRTQLEAALIRLQHAEAASASTLNAVSASAEGNVLRSENAELRSQLDMERGRVIDLENRVRNSVYSKGDISNPTNKKNEDRTLDLEAAALGGGNAFKPLVGVVRSWPPPLGNNVHLHKVALQLDKAAVALDSQPLIRAGVIIYLVVLHIMVIL